MISYIDLDPEKKIKIFEQAAFSIHKKKKKKKGYGDVRCLRSDPGTHLGIFFNPYRLFTAP